MNMTQVMDFGYAVTDGAQSIGVFFKSELIRFTFMAIVVILIIIIIKMYANKLFSTVKSEGIDWQQNDWIRKGTPNVRRMRLRYLFTSVGGKKTHKVGRIVSYLPLTDAHILIGVRRMYEHMFYYVAQEDITMNSGDIILKSWNYIRNDKVMMPNRSTVPAEFPYMKAELKSLDDLSKYTLNAIKSNPYHRIKLRERGLVNQEDDYNYQFDLARRGQA